MLDRLFPMIPALDVQRWREGARPAAAIPAVNQNSKQRQSFRTDWDIAIGRVTVCPNTGPNRRRDRSTSQSEFCVGFEAAQKRKGPMCEVSHEACPFARCRSECPKSSVSNRHSWSASAIGMAFSAWLQTTSSCLLSYSDSIESALPFQCSSTNN